MKFTTLLALFISANNDIKTTIFKHLKILNFNLGANTIDEFYSRANICRELRNCVSHNNSLNIYKNYKGNVFDLNGKRRKKIDNVIKIVLELPTM